MKKLIRIRSVAALCLFFRNSMSKYTLNQMHLRHIKRENSHLKASIAQFFERHPPETVRYFTLLIFQCWAVNDCKLKSSVTDLDFAEFLDQLNDFLSSLSNIHKPTAKIKRFG